MRMRWIGFTGKMGAGKDYAYDVLHARHSVERISFADGLRLEIQSVLGLSEPIRKPYTELERKLQQWWGTDYRRAEDPEYWVNIAEKRARAALGLPVFTDVRFPNEAEMIKRNGGFIVRMTASEQARRARLGMIPPDHESEAAMDNYPVDLNVPTDLGEEMYESGMSAVEKMAGLK